MGVTGLYLCQNEPGASNATLLTDITEGVIGFCPEEAGRRIIEYKLFREHESTNTLHTLTSSGFPERVFCTGGDDETAVAIRGEVEGFLSSSLTHFKLRSTTRGEGPLYRLGHITVAVLSLTQQTFVKGVVLEIEVPECEDLQEGRVLMQAFVERLGLKGTLYANPPEGDFSPLNTACQYFSLIRDR